MGPLRRTASHGGQNVQRTLSSSLRHATEKTTAPKARQKDSAAGPGEPVTGFQRVKYSQAGRSVTPAGRRSSSSRGRSHSRVRPREVTQAPLQEHWEDPRVTELIQENACLKAELHQLRADLESFRKSYSSQGETQQTPPPGDAQARSGKRRASPPEAEWDAMETQSNSNVLESM
ncbi:hypothetical protein MTO96_033855 [Rhipicephalus appendiculatus]